MAAKAAFRWTVDPVQQVQRMSSGIRNKALRIALNAASSPVKAAVIASAPKDAGHLAKSTRIKVKNYRSGDVWIAVVGAGSSYKRSKRNKNGSVKTIRPAFYQHLVDQGSKHNQARHYLKASFQQSQSAFEARARQKLAEVLTELMAK